MTTTMTTASARPEAATRAALLEVHDLKTVFDRRGAFGLLRAGDSVAAVDGVSFDVGEGETLGIVGESGCGKTTLGRTILRLVPARSGSVRYRGEEILRLPAAAFRAKRRELQMIFQDLDAALNPKMRVGDLLAEALTLHRQPSREEVRRRSEDPLDLVKLKPAKLSAFPPELSGGEKRRVSIARVLAVEPQLIVADEPLSALDVSIAGPSRQLDAGPPGAHGAQLPIHLPRPADGGVGGLPCHRHLPRSRGGAGAGPGPGRGAGASLFKAALVLPWTPYAGRRMETTGTQQWELPEAERPQTGCRFRDRCPVYHAKGEPAVCRDKETERRSPSSPPAGSSPAISRWVAEAFRGAELRGKVPVWTLNSCTESTTGT